jgi:hypothetical protein
MMTKYCCHRRHLLAKSSEMMTAMMRASTDIDIDIDILNYHEGQYATTIDTNEDYGETLRSDRICYGLEQSV